MSSDDAAPVAPPSPAEAALPRESPDFVEQDHSELLDNIVPTRGYQMMPMVGLGGSAGGIAALQEFFKAMPADSGMVFVVILHLSPTHESTLADLLSRVTTMHSGAGGRWDARETEPRLCHPAGQAPRGDRRASAADPAGDRAAASGWRSISSFARSPIRTGRTRRRSFSRARTAMARSASSGSRNAAG